MKINDKLVEIYKIGYIKDIEIKIEINNNEFTFFFISPESFKKYNNQKENNNIEKILVILNDIVNKIKNINGKIIEKKKKMKKK